MPTVYLRKDLYDAIIKKGANVQEFVNDAIESALAPKSRLGRKLKEEEED